MAKDFEMGYLLDFYGEVLTPKQREMLRQYAEQVYCVNPTGEFNRHIVSTTPGVPYDMMTLILNSER